MSSTPENPQQPWQAPQEQVSWPRADQAPAEQAPQDPYAGTGSEGRASAQDAAQQGRWGQPGPQAEQPGQSSTDQQAPASGQAQYAPAGQRPPGTDLGSDISAAMRWMWQSFTRNLSAFLVPGIVYGLLMLLLIGGAIAAYVWGFVSDMQYDPVAGEYTPNLERLLIGLGIFTGLSLLTMIPSLLWQSGSARAAATIVDGRRPSTGEAFTGPGRVIATALLVAVITFIGSLLCYLPGLLAAFFFLWAIPASTHGASPIEALKESARLAKENVATTIVTMLIIYAASSIGGTFLLPLVVLPALAALFLRGMYERLNGRELVEPQAA